MRVRVVWKSGTDEANAPPEAPSISAPTSFGTDDGPSGIDQSLAMLKLAAAHGTTDIVATPRATFKHPFDPEMIEQRVAELRARTEGSIRIHSGCDFHFGLRQHPRCASESQQYAVNGPQPPVVEFPDTVIPAATDEILGKFRKAGLVPFIAHPERNPLLQQSVERLKAWISIGCVLQITARSLSGHFGKLEQECAWDLLREGWVYVLASDARDVLHQPPRLDGAWRMNQTRTRRRHRQTPSDRQPVRDPAWSTRTKALDPAAAVADSHPRTDILARRRHNRVMNRRQL